MDDSRKSENGPPDSISSQLRKHVPQNELCLNAFGLVSETVAEPILNHSLRVFLFAKWVVDQEGVWWESEHDLNRLFVACIGHDLGASDRFNGSQRFEVEGADATVQFLTTQGVPAVEAHEVWTAIALHTSPGIAERISFLARLVRLGVLLDFRQATRIALGAVEYGKSIDAEIPRLDIEKILGDMVVRNALDQRDSKAPAASWPGILVRSHLENPYWEGVNKAF